jgi:peptidoglycan/LPS O-acetylase OafA/YrhL
VALALLFGNILLAWLALKLYDEPLRKFLSKRFSPPIKQV